MHRLKFCALASALFFYAASAHAAPDEAALALRNAAIHTDFLAMDFTQAAKKLALALELCGVDRCSKATRSLVLFDSGAVALLQNKPEEAVAHFEAALAVDAALVPDEDVASRDVKELFLATKSKERPTPPKESAPPRKESSLLGPQRADDASDCPPSFPGCRSQNEHAAPESPDSIAPPSPEPARSNWISIAFEQDLLLLESADGACSGGSGYSCFGEDRGYYGATPLEGADNRVNGGLAPATRRLVAGYDRRVGRNFTAGARAGYAFGGGPGRPSARGFLPIHAEARVTYWIGSDPLSRRGLRPFFLGAVGIGQIDASVPVTVYADERALRSGQSQAVQAWRKSGIGFGALGVGAMYPVTASSGIALEAKVLQAFPTPATGFGFQLAYLVGL